ncbi:probable G-protein coupled receptor frpr-1 [Euwallacea similis]|uniref:probable G-protein coupled receptor frpr-1 n=1 Tax=Euwallacea similis TaxID=1736056 RepID=UPI00344F61C0
MSFYFLTSSIPFNGEADICSQEPTTAGIILYSVVTPVLCCCGIIGNTISLLVLKRKELKGSVYTYLAVLACVDLGTSIVLLLGGISRGIMWKYGWITYDSLIGLPISGVLATLGVFAIVGLTSDRVIYLWNPIQCTKPKFCNSWVARRVMIASFILAILSNLPYCFIYEWQDDGSLTTTSFFASRLYRAFNWFTLFVFAIIPAIILLMGNGFLILSLRKARKINNKTIVRRTNRRKRRDSTSLTITLVMIIVDFLITNIPESLVSRTAAINLLFQGDRHKANSETLEKWRQICTILAAIDVNTNFVFYYTFCPAFCKALKGICRCKKRRQSNNLQVNVFVLNGAKPNEISNIEEQHQLNKQMQKVLEISRKSFESAFTLNLGEIDTEKPKNERSLNYDYEFLADRPSKYDTTIENVYTPPFSTIIEESSTSSVNSDSATYNKNIRRN